MSSAKKNRKEAASCSHVSRIFPVLFHRAHARERDEAQRNRAALRTESVYIYFPPHKTHPPKRDTPIHRTVYNYGTYFSIKSAGVIISGISTPIPRKSLSSVMKISTFSMIAV